MAAPRGQAGEPVGSAGGGGEGGTSSAIDVKLGALFEYAGGHGIPLYVLIDEYDNFANTVLVHRGREACESFTRGGGFYRNFFAALKAGTGEAGGLERLFITGVSPITMGRRHQRLQHRPQRHPEAGVQRSARLHRTGGARPADALPGAGAHSTRTWTRPWT